MIAKTWTVKIFLSEEDGLTKARAVLEAEGRVPVTGHGDARRNPHDPYVAEIGDELATARAMCDLGRRLLGVSAEDITAMTGEYSVLNI